MDRSGETLVGRYRLLRQLGSGGMGTVYLGEHVHLGRPTAVKLLHKELCCVPDAEDRFRREALLAAKINHAAVAQVYDFDHTPDGEFLLAMEYVEGETVAQRLKREGRFELGLAALVLLAAAEGLDRAHSLGILHRDIKPENLILAPGGAVKLLDFGVARPLDPSASITSSGFAVGTPAYMSPEQLVGEPVGPASDLYALATVFYEMVTGERPHAGGTFPEFRARRLMHPPTAPHLLRRECPPAVSDAVGRALAVEPGARWPSAVAFARAVEDALARPMGAPPAGPVRSGRGRVSEQLQRWEAHFEALRYAGRGREARQVRDAWAAARAGRTTVLWIEGDEGAGKSAFFELALREATADRAGVIVGRGYEADVVRPYGPWLPMLRTALGMRAGRARVWPAIEALSDARLETPAPERAALYDEVATLVCSAAAEGPLLLGMEDFEWCDSASISLTEFLAHDVAGVPLLVAVTAVAGPSRGAAQVREVRERLRRREGVVRASLRPLGYEAVASWLSGALGHEAPEELVRFVYGHTEGNAFFIEQVVRSLVETGGLDRISTESARVALSDAPPPEAVAEVVQRRLKGMSPAAREILQIAAVVGREFDVDLVVAISTRSEDAVLDALDEAVLAGALAPVARAGGDWYRFTHGKTGQVLAQAINPRRRRKLHGQIAEALAARAETMPGQVAWHWYHAGDVARASQAARAASRHALLVHDYDDALTFGVMAAETAKTPGERREAHELRGDALRRLDRHGEAAAAYAHARLAGDGDPETTLDLRRKELRAALLAGTVGPDAAAAELKRLAAGAGAIPALRRASLDLALAEALLAAGHAKEAALAASRAQRAAFEAGDRFQAGDALLALGAAQLEQGDHSGAERHAGEAAAIFAEIGDPYGAARAASLTGSAAAAARNVESAHAAFDEALRQAERARVTRLVRQIERRRAELGV
ncbi:MAG: protein kinase [Gemmatimonadetes bacterium]|nr:protein kinase [Gemmatimonadota bacterium]